MPSDEDYLTKLFNRRSYEAEVSYLVRSKKPFGIIIFDLNDFKEINDLHGHHKGDEVLLHFSNALSRVFSKEGLASRLGGDEFAVILRGSRENVDPYINKLKTYILRSEDEVFRKLTFSYGFEKHYMDMSIDDLYKQADQKMYLQKRRIKKRKDMSEEIAESV
jgi:diguanylate cyclase (GGDEF)-like protein